MLRFLGRFCSLLLGLAAPASAQLPHAPRPTGGPAPGAYQAERRQGLPRRPAARHPRALQRASSSPRSWPRARPSPHCCDQLGMYRDLVYATPGLTAAQTPQLLQGLELRRQARRRRAHLLAALGRHDRARQGLRRPARLRPQPRRRDVRARLRRRRGPAVLHGRAAPRRPRAALELRRRLERGDGRRAVGGRPVHGGRPHAPGRTRSRSCSARQGEILKRDVENYIAGINRVHRRGASSTRRSCRASTPRPAIRTGPDAVEARGPDRHRVAGRRHLRQAAAATSWRGREVAERASTSASAASAARACSSDFRAAEDKAAPVTVLGKKRFPYQVRPPKPRRGSVARPDPGSLRRHEVVASGGDAPRGCRCRAPRSRRAPRTRC